MRGPSFHGTPDAASIWQPAITSSPLQAVGIPIGYERRLGRKVYFWPYSLVSKQKLITCEGLRGGGKSTFMKIMSIRLSLAKVQDTYGRPSNLKVRISSRKSENREAEYKPIFDALHKKLYSFSRGDGFNIFGLFRREEDVAVVALSVAEHLSDILLTPRIKIAILAGVHKMFATTSNPHPVVLERMIRTLTENEYNRFYYSDDTIIKNLLEEEIAGNPNLLKELHLDRDTDNILPDSSYAVQQAEALNTQAKNDAADLFKILTSGFGGIFKGTSSLYDVLTNQFVGFDWENIAEGADDIIDSILLRAEASAITNQSDSLGNGRDLANIIPHATFSDEEGEANNRLIHLEAQASKINKARAYQTMMFQARQYYIQTTLAGDKDTRRSGLAQQIELGIGARIVFQQPDNDDILHYYTKLGVSDENAHKLTTLEPGEAMMLVAGRDPYFFTVGLTSLESPLIQTVSAARQMNEHTNLSTQQEYIDRVARINQRDQLHIGLDQSDHG